jgi:micrococcal nuclease
MNRRVVDGDTIDVQLTGWRVRVRSIGVNSPETKHPTKGVEPCGPEPSDVQPWDGRQRLRAYVNVGDVMVNTELVRQGYAQVATFPPHVRYADRFRRLQQEPCAARSGWWKTP